MGLGTFGTSLLFLGAILATVVYLSVTRADVIEDDGSAPADEPPPNPQREKISLAVLAAAAVGTVSLLAWANAQPHQSALAEEGPAPSCSGSAINQDQAVTQVAQSFPASSVDNYRTITQDTLAMVDAGDQKGAQARVTDLETAWDDDEGSLQPKDCQAWTFVDTQIDDVLSSVRASNPDQAAEDQALHDLLVTLG